MKSIEDFTGELKFVEDLLYYDGPLVSLYKNDQDENFLYWWLNNETHVQNWALLKLSQTTVDDFINKKKTCLETIKSAFECYLVCCVFEKDKSYNLVYSCSFEEILKDCLPKEDVFLYHD